MTQDTSSGASANDYGHANAAQIANALGAILTERGRSNAALLDGVRIVIKSARRKTTSVGVPYALLNRVESVVAAFERSEFQYDVFELSRKQYEKYMRPRVTDGAAGLVSRRIFIEHGKSLGTIKLKQK